MLYIILIWVCLIWLISPSSCGYIKEGNVQKKNQRRFLYTIATLSLIIYCALRDPFIYPDNITYYEEFMSDWNSPDETFNFGYIWLNKFIAFIWKNYYFFSIIVAVLICGSYCKFIKRYSPNIYLALVLFIFINYYPSFFIIRQYLAMPFLLLSVRYIIKQDFVKYLTCVVLACSMHTSAVVFAPIYFLYKLRYNKFSMFLVLAFTIIASLSLMAVGQYFATFFPAYSHYLEREVEDAAWQRAVMKIFICFVFIYASWNEKNFYREGINRIVFYSMLFNIIICIGAMKMLGVFRLRDFFSLADIVGVPIILYYNKYNAKFKRFVVLAATSVYIVLLLITFVRFVNSDNLNNSYQFFWNGHPHEWTK